MLIRVAEQKDYAAVQDFYWRICEAMPSSPFDGKWRKEIYPSNELLQTSIAQGELYLLQEQNAIIGAMIMNHEGNESYAKCSWQVQAPAEAISVIHALGVLPKLQGRGYAKLLVAEAVRVAQEQQQAALRLDVLTGNLPAKALYEGFGFLLQQTVRMYYEDTGWTEFVLYEKPLR